MKEHLKTVILILLGLSAAFLVYRAWVYDSGLFGMEAQGPSVFAPERLDYAPSSAVPAKCAVISGGERSGTQYDEAARAVYDAFKLLLGDALGAAANAELLDHSRMWQDALRRDGVYFEFTGGFPLSLVAAWLSADVSHLSGIPLYDGVEAIGLVFDGDSVQVYWVYLNGDFWLAETEARFPGWPELPELRPCVFAFESEFAGVWAPRQLLMEESRHRTAAALSLPPHIGHGDSVYAPFLETLNLSPSGATFYDRSDGRVYVNVENGSSCAFLTDGSVRFSSPAITPALLPGLDTSVAADVLRAWDVLSRLEPVMGDGRFEAYRVTREGYRTAIEFVVMIGSVPVLWETAVVEVNYGTIEQISLKLRYIGAGDASGALLPLRQTAALAPPGGASRLDLRYVPDLEASASGGDAHILWVVSE